MIELTLYLITAVLYGLLGLRDLALQLRPGHAFDAAGSESPAERQVHQLIPLAWVTHILLLQHTVFHDGHLDLSIGHAISMIGAATMAIYWIGSRHTPLGILRPAILLISGVACLMPLLLTSEKDVSIHHNIAFELHIVLSLLAYSLFIIAALHAGLMALQERRLQAGEVGGRLGRLPPLVAMDAILFKMVMTGFVLLTLTLASGLLFSEELFGRPFKFNHKNLLGVISWAIFAGLLVGRWGYGWRGRRAARWTIAGFVVLVLGYLGQKVVLELILHRA